MGQSRLGKRSCPTQLPPRHTQDSEAVPREVLSRRCRWSKHLKPGLSKESEWSTWEQEVVCRLQAEHGNRWSLIAAQLPGRTDNAVKNYFYSSLRKALRKINHYITEHRNQPICRGIKVISETTIGKVVALAEGKPGRMRILAQDITQLARGTRPATQTSSRISSAFGRAGSQMRRSRGLSPNCCTSTVIAVGCADPPNPPASTGPNSLRISRAVVLSSPLRKGA